MLRLKNMTMMLDDVAIPLRHPHPNDDDDS